MTQKFKKITEELTALYDKKNAAYGNAFSQTYNNLGLISAVTRISDKFNRLVNLSKNREIDNCGESIDDTLRDMACYCIMTLMELDIRNEFGWDVQSEEKQSNDRTTNII